MLGLIIFRITRCLLKKDLTRVDLIHRRLRLVVPMDCIPPLHAQVTPNVQKLRFPASLVIVAQFVQTPISTTAATVPENMFSPAIVVAANIIIAFVTLQNIKLRQTEMVVPRVKK